MTLTANTTDILKSGLSDLCISHLDHEPFIRYIELLLQWNRAYNLTAIKHPNDIVAKHILDSLAVLPKLEGQNLLDVGTGPGLPGIPLAIARTDLRVVLLDSNGKKIRFLNEVVRVLRLNHVTIEQSRVEHYCPEQRFDTIVSRAFSQADDMIAKTKHLLKNQGQWLAMKGRILENELKALDALSGMCYSTYDYTVPFVDGKRCCLIIRPNASH